MFKSFFDSSLQLHRIDFKDNIRSMLSRWGGGRGERPGIGGEFDVTSLPVVWTFDHSSSPGRGSGLLTLTVSRLGSTDAILDDRHLE